MSLDRFANKEELLAGASTYAIKWTEELSSGGMLINLANLEGQNDLIGIGSAEGVYAEIHLYDNEGVHVESSIVNTTLEETNEALIFHGSNLANAFNVKSGEYLAVVNILAERLGSESEPSLKVEEFSPDRTEIYLRGRTESSLYASVLSDMEENVIESDIRPGFSEELRSGNLLLNFGKGRINSILARGAWDDADGIILKTLKPVSEEIIEGDPAYISYELADPIVLYMNFVFTEGDFKVYLRKPNFGAESDYNTITETDFKTFTELLGSSTATSEQIIQKMISGSIPDSPIGIDYSAFENFVFYSSAAERLANFKYKLQQIEHYESQLELLTNTSIPSVSADRQIAENRKTAVIGSFDGFEKWLYYEPTSSLFTHQAVYDRAHRSGNPTRLEGGTLAADTYQIQPFPKFLSSSFGTGELRVHSSTSTIATEWYNGTLASASLYDTFNDNALVNTIPEHIRLDSNNDQYELFVNMIGQHYDILYSYADALAKTYHPIEHPKLGHTKETLFNVAKSMGWKLFNGKQASALWQYKLGKSETGSLASTGSIFTKTDEEITTEVWRRIVNNIPYLLKTKGTARGIKALMNTYGIPQTLLSIREYGGPKVSEDAPLLIEDRFSYALQFASGSGIKYNRDRIKFGDLGGRGIGVVSQTHPTFTAPSGITDAKLNHRVPDTIEFRFKPAIKDSMLLLSHGSTSTLENVHWNLGVQYTASYSGSDAFGRLFFQVRDLNGNTGTSQLAGSAYDEMVGNSIVSYTDYVPLYDGDFWNVRLFSLFPFITSSHTAEDQFVPDIRFQTQKASDYISDKIIHQTSGSINFGSGSNVTNGENLVAYWGANTTAKEITIGGASGSGLINTSLGGLFTGSIQEYREWMEVLDQKAFNLHTTNPTSYVSSITATSSFDTLVRHYPLGTNLNAIDHSTGAGLFITSSHPDQSIQDFTTPLDDTITQHGKMESFPTPINSQRGNYEPIEETYYVQGVSLGASLPKSQKIRFDNNELVTMLSPAQSAERSRFDNASLDSNRLGLFYSMADQINKEIFNHVGDIALDDYVGDPDDQYDHEYPDLTDFSNEYWKKYSDRNDINAFMRVFSQFDFALFESIRQMLPDRADEVMGLLVEPHALERAKTVVGRKPEQSSHHYDSVITGMSPTASGEFPFYEGAASGSPEMSGETPFSPAAGDNGYDDIGNYADQIILNTSSSTDYFTKHVFVGDQRPSITSSIISVYSVQQENEGFQYESEGFFNLRHGDSYIRRRLASEDELVVSESLANNVIIGLPFASDKVRVQIDTYTQTDSIQDLRFDIIHKDDATGGQAILYARLISTHNNENGGDYTTKSDVSAIPSGSNFISRQLTERVQKAFAFSGTDFRTDSISFNDVHIPRRTNITLEFFYTSQVPNGDSGHSIRPEIDKISIIRTISKAGFSAVDEYIDAFRPSNLFKKKVLHYHTNDTSKPARFNDYLNVASQSLHLSLFANADDAFGTPSTYVTSQSLAEIHYRDDDNHMRETKFFGTSISAPGVNELSGYSEIGYEPIVEIFITNPNQVVYNATPAVTETGQENPGNITVTAGPGILTNRPSRPSRPSVSYRR